VAYRAVRTEGMMKRIVLMGAAAAAMLTAGCASVRMPKVRAPAFKAPQNLNLNPFEASSTGSYSYAGKRYRRWREDWIAPPDYVERQWAVGETLPAEYLDGRFTIVWNLRKLPFPGEGRLWVRVGKDALLVEKTGRVNLVIDNFYF
jgi:Ni/Co efflux regulator RcnB